MNVVMIGTGYVGLVTGLGYAKLGHRVACVDVDASKVARLDRGEAPFYEPGLTELLREMQEAGRVVFATDLAEVIGGAEIIVIAVGTPSAIHSIPSLEKFWNVACWTGISLARAHRASAKVISLL